MIALLQGVPIPPTPPGVESALASWQVVEIVQSVLILIGVIAIGYPIVRALSRRFIERPTPPSTAIPHDLAERLERIEQSVDAIAIEMERVAESQRYSAKLLSESRDAGRLPESR